MSSSFDAPALAGRSLADVFVELVGSSDWDVANPRPDGGVDLSRLADLMLPGADLPPSPRDTPELRRLLQALETGELQVEADGGAAEGYTAVPVPAGLWRQKYGNRRWQLYHDDNGDRLEMVEGGHVIETRYNPRFAAVAQVPEPKRRGRKPIDRLEDIARGVDLALANGDNFMKAAADLYDELHPPPGKDAPLVERTRWENNRDPFVARLRGKISKARGKS